ncbi:MAG: peptidoglycan DD-metalloendopeptidase family protein [Deltaproteobacteria bacterium]|nr:peptidoglycan DD-metalloendopeptidase family protein [Deltaproteobacteria bacterium]
MSLALAIGCVLIAQAPGQDPGFGGEAAFDRGLDARDGADREKAAMRRRLAEDRVRSQFLRREEASILSAMQALDRRLDEQRRRGAALIAERGHLEAQIARVDVELDHARDRLAALRDEIARRASAMVRLRRTSLSELFARARSGSELRRLRDRIRLALAHDAQLVRAARDASEEARRLGDELSRRREALAAAAVALAAEEEQTLDTRAERGALLTAVQGERQLIERIAGEIAAAARKLDSELGTIHGAGPVPPPAPGGFAAQRGRLPWPATGRIEVPFGKRVDPETGMIMAHKGVDIRASLTEPVRAVFAGKAAFAGWLEGFGRMVIVEHDGGWYTIYAHLERFQVKVGEALGQGQVLGFVGDSGSLKGVYLYFELREGKRAIDPLTWLSR